MQKNKIIGEEGDESYNKKSCSECNAAEKIKQTSIDRIITILTAPTCKKENMDALINILKIETGNYSSMRDVFDNGTYILIKNLLLASPRQIRTTITYSLIARAMESPFAIIALLREMDTFNTPGIIEIPTIRAAQDIIDRLSFERITNK